MNSQNIGESYNQIAQWWTDTQLKTPEYGMVYIRKAMNYVGKNAKMLDIGCGGTGRVIKEASKLGFDITGLDISLEMIKLARQAHPDVKFIHDDFVEWRNPVKYDLIIAWDSIFHAPRHLQDFITEKMCNMLEKNGVLIFTAGGIDDERNGEMEGVLFEYGSLKYLDYLRIIDKSGCNMILMESDQYPLDHVVFICQKS